MLVFSVAASSNLPWVWVWVIVAAILYVGEMFTTSFFMLPFAIGATAAAIVAALGLDFVWQLALMVLVSVIALAATRPLAHRLTAGGSQEKSGVDRLIGIVGIVLPQAAPSGEARVRIEREIWNATTVSPGPLVPGDSVRVLGVDGVHLIVERVQMQQPPQIPSMQTPPPQQVASQTPPSQPPQPYQPQQPPQPPQ